MLGNSSLHTSVPQKRNHASQSEIVVVLLAKLLLGEGIQCVHLPRKGSRVWKTFSEERNFSYQTGIRNHH